MSVTTRRSIPRPHPDLEIRLGHGVPGPGGLEPATSGVTRRRARTYAAGRFSALLRKGRATYRARAPGTTARGERSVKTVSRKRCDFGEPVSEVATHEDVPDRP